MEASHCEHERREAARQRSEAYRDRKRRGVMLVSIEVEARSIAALERLALLPRGERDPYEVACAVAQFLMAAPSVAAMGDALWPVPNGDASPGNSGNIDAFPS